jgi:hypothetical protein
MQTLNEQDIDYIVTSFKAWCAAHAKPAPTSEDALAYFTYAQENEPFIAERMDGDWDDFLAFLQGRWLVGG